MTFIPQKLPLTSFGEVSVAEPTPITQILAINGLTSKTDSFSFLGGLVIADDSQFIISTGTTPGAFAAILSSRNSSYRAGQGSRCKVTGRFTAGVADSTQLCGFISATDSLAFGYDGDEFGVIRRHDGRSEIQEFQITSSTTGAGDVTVTIDGTPYTVAVTVGTVQVNALEISNSLNSQVPNYNFTSNDDTVVAVSDIAEPMDAFAFALDTATGTAGTWTEIQSGALAVVDFTAQADWSEDPMPDLDPTKGNVYDISFQYLGYGPMLFSIGENEKSLKLVHIIEYSNLFTLPSLGDPTFTVGWTVASAGSTTDLVLAGASAGMFVEGKAVITEAPRTITNTLLAVGTTPTNLLTIRNRSVRGDRRNRAATALLEASAVTDSIKGVVIDLIIDADVAGSPTFQYVDKTLSNTEFDVVGTTVTGGTSIGVLSAIAGSSDEIDLDKIMATLLPNQTLTLAAFVVAIPAADVTANLIYQEDI